MFDEEGNVYEFEYTCAYTAPSPTYSAGVNRRAGGSAPGRYRRRLRGSWRLGSDV